MNNSVLPAFKFNNYSFSINHSDNLLMSRPVETGGLGGGGVGGGGALKFLQIFANSEKRKK